MANQNQDKSIKGGLIVNILHQLEQIQALLRDVATVLYSYKEHLKKQGFTEQQAYNLVRDYQQILLSKNK